MNQNENFSLEFPVPVEATIVSTKRQKKNCAKTRLCLVCQDNARIINYGALSCSSCKTFFRRHGFRIEKIEPCRFNGRCEVTIRSRRVCGACRLAKCLKVGMSPDLIRKEDFSDRTSQVKQNVKRKSSIFTLDLLNDDRSKLNREDWTLIGNVLQTYDSFSSARSARDEIGRNSSLPLKIRQKTAQQSIPNLILSFYTTLKSLVQCTNEFRSLTFEERNSLCQRNFHAVSTLTGQLILRESTIQQDPAFMAAFTSHYSLKILLHADSIMKRMDSDSNMVKIFLVVLSFSSNCFHVDERRAHFSDALIEKTDLLIRFQNFYVEILWKFMVYRYGEHQASIRFLGLTKQIVDLISLNFESFIHEESYRRLVNEITERTHHFFII